MRDFQQTGESAGSGPERLGEPRPVDVLIRRATPDDTEQIADVHARAWQEAYRGLLPDEVRERGHTAATLWVLRQNDTARRFYEAAAWQPDGATKDEWRPGGTLHEVRYRRSLRRT